jgi:hypothetical protein
VAWLIDEAGIDGRVSFWELRKNEDSKNLCKYRGTEEAEAKIFTADPRQAGTGLVIGTSGNRDIG